MKPIHFFIIGTLIIVLLINGSIIKKEIDISNSVEIKIKLRPVDPRSMMQGDYMRLRYDIPSKVIGETKKGLLKITLDAENFVTDYALYQGEELASNQHLLHFMRKKYGRLHIGSESFLFQEGKADYYAKSTHAIFYLTPEGKTLLKDLYLPLKKADIKR